MDRPTGLPDNKDQLPYDRIVGASPHNRGEVAGVPEDVLDVLAEFDGEIAIAHLGTGQSLGIVDPQFFELQTDGRYDTASSRFKDTTYRLSHSNKPPLGRGDALFEYDPETVDWGKVKTDLEQLFRNPIK